MIGLVDSKKLLNELIVEEGTLLHLATKVISKKNSPGFEGKEMNIFPLINKNNDKFQIH